MKRRHKPYYYLAATVRLFLITLAITLFSGKAFAHQPDQAFIYLEQTEDRLSGRLEITKGDLQKVLRSPIVNGNGLEGLANYIEEARRYVTSNLRISTEQGTHALIFHDTRLRTASGWGGEFLLLEFEFEGLEGIPESMEVHSDMLYQQVPDFQLWVIMEHSFKTGYINNESIPFVILTEGDRTQSFELGEGSNFQGFIAMVKMGVWHIWIGIDHILFLIALLLPSVIYHQKETKKWVFVSYNDAEPRAGFRGPFMYILKVVTFFTLAHTITLSLASLEIINLPSRFVESIIAASIALAAIHNIRPVAFVQNREWLIAFVFGLFHGFGFATVLGELGIGGQYAVISLIGFNVGVEVGQVAIIFIVFPILFLVRNIKRYPLYMVQGSMVLIFVATYWFIERAFNVDLPLGRYVFALFR